MIDNIKDIYNILKCVENLKGMDYTVSIIPVPLIPLDKLIVVGRKVYVNEYNWEKLVFMLLGLNEQSIDIVINYAKKDCIKHINYLVNFKYNKHELIST